MSDLFTETMSAYLSAMSPQAKREDKMLTQIQDDMAANSGGMRVEQMDSIKKSLRDSIESGDDPAIIEGYRRLIYRVAPPVR